MSIWSARYASATLALLLVTLLPTTVASYLRPVVREAPELATALPVELAGRSSLPTRRTATSMQREFASGDWVEREYTHVDEPAVKLLAVRSYDMKRLYHHPELAVSETDFEDSEVVTVPSSAGPLSIHVLRSANGGLAAYALLFRGRTVANPLLFQLAVAPDLLIAGRRPMTLVFGEQPPAAGADPDTARAAAVRLVTAAVDELVRRVH